MINAVEYCHYSSGASVVPVKSSTAISVEIPLVRKTVLFHGKTTIIQVEFQRYLQNILLVYQWKFYWFSSEIPLLFQWNTAIIPEEFQ